MPPPPAQTPKGPIVPLEECAVSLKLAVIVAAPHVDGVNVAVHVAEGVVLLPSWHGVNDPEIPVMVNPTTPFGVTNVPAGSVSVTVTVHVWP